MSALKRIRKQTDLTAKHSDPRSPHENGLGEPLIKIPLMLATVKEERDAAIRFCFRIITPQESLLLQAQNLEDMNEFMDSVQHAISEGLNAQMAGGRESSAEETAEQKRVMTALRKKPGNELCADCGCADPDSVTWASVNLGVLLCLDCSGVHRAMGTHVSKIRSAILDTKQWTDVMLSMFDGLGNAVVNQIYEKDLGGRSKPTTESPRVEKEEFIRAKYEQRQFLGSADALGGAGGDAGGSEEERIGKALIAACMREKLSECLQLIALRPDSVNWRDPAQSNLFPLLCAAAPGHNAVIEMLLLNGAEIDMQGGADNRSALQTAVSCKREESVELLIAKGASVELVDEHGQTATQICADVGGSPVLQATLKIATATAQMEKQKQEAATAREDEAEAHSAEQVGSGAGDGLADRLLARASAVRVCLPVAIFECCLKGVGGCRLCSAANRLLRLTVTAQPPHPCRTRPQSETEASVIQ